MYGEPTTSFLSGSNLHQLVQRIQLYKPLLSPFAHFIERIRSFGLNQTHTFLKLCGEILFQVLGATIIGHNIHFILFRSREISRKRLKTAAVLNRFHAAFWPWTQAQPNYTR